MRTHNDRCNMHTYIRTLVLCIDPEHLQSSNPITNHLQHHSRTVCQRMRTLVSIVPLEGITEVAAKLRDVSAAGPVVGWILSAGLVRSILTSKFLQPWF